MKVVVLGGYGAFGARLVHLLVRDDHEVVVAGRSLEKAAALAREVSAESLVCDRNGSLEALWATQPDVVIDAVGPFHSYVDDPYRLAKACIAQKVHYLDLCDDAEFCAGISALDASANAAGVACYSGVSSVPAISSAVVTALTQNALEIDTISTAILPGNRAPRGLSVVQSILNQVGRPMQATVDGVSQTQRGWSDPALFDFGGGLRRRGWIISVPDQRLFPAHFGARTVMFRAGLELGVMNWTLAVLSIVRGKLGFGIPDWFCKVMLWLANALWFFGTDVGGMSVCVVAREGEGFVRRRWQMVVRKGDGPFIPGIAVRALLRDPQNLISGARPALSVVSLDKIEEAMGDLAVTTSVETEPSIPVFADFLGDDFVQLPPRVREGHLVRGPKRWAGRAKVTRGGSLWSRLLAALFGFPPATEDTNVQVVMTPKDGGELWERRFGDRCFWSFLKVKNGVMTERFGPLTFELGLHVRADALHYPVSRGRIGPIPLPSFLLPVSIAREFERDGRFHFDVELRAPLTGALMVHYQGWLAPEASGLGD